mgnify:CR=1 FL=1
MLGRDAEGIALLSEALERIEGAIAREEKILIYGDYDVDGVTGTSVLLSVLRKLGANVDFYIPNRASEGYGLNLKAVSVLASKHRTKLNTFRTNAQISGDGVCTPVIL